jgi:electron transport complex protein RnfB
MEDKMADDIFRKVQKRLDGYSLGFPATDSGIELEILRELFTEEDAGMFLNLTQRLEKPERTWPVAWAGRLMKLPHN